MSSLDAETGVSDETGISGVGGFVGVATTGVVCDVGVDCDVGVVATGVVTDGCGKVALVGVTGVSGCVTGVVGVEGGVLSVDNRVAVACFAFLVGSGGSLALGEKGISSAAKHSFSQA